MAKTITVREYESFTCNKNVPGHISLPESTFKNLEEFILANNNQDSEVLEFMGIMARKGIGKVITAKNYVGVISMNDGTTIEILPKIYSEQDTVDEAKKLLIKMLKTLRTAPYKTMQKTNVNIDKLSIFEIFIRMFLDEVFMIVKRGLKCNYESIQDNLNVFKGKMLFSKQVKYNIVHKEKFFVEYDEFNTNRAENRLLKSTLLYLYQKTTSNKNKNDIRTLLNSFVDVNESTNYDDDFSRCIADRNMKGYTTALLWSKVFLQGKSFTSFSGANIAFALLFPMETLFESYVASLMRKQLQGTNYSFSAQDKGYHLFDNPKKFALRPDIVMKHKTNNMTFVMDTKWKLLSLSKANAGISQADMYQMYAYQKKYKAQNIILLYPKTAENIDEDKLIFKSDDGATVHVKFVDLYNKKSIGDLLAEILNGCNQDEHGNNLVLQ